MQPFGGRGLSGTGPKAGGPLYLRRLVREAPRFNGNAITIDSVLSEFISWLDARKENQMADVAQAISAASPVGMEIELPGPVGERNVYALHPRGTILLRPATRNGLLHLIGAALATGNTMVIEADDELNTLIHDMPTSVRARIDTAPESISAALVEGDDDAVLSALQDMAERPGAIVSVHAATSAHMLSANAYCPYWLIEEVSTSINTTAAGGNASLIAMA